MSCRYLENVLSRQDNSKAILRCFEHVLCRLGLVPDKIEIKREMLSNYELKIFEFYNVPMAMSKNVNVNHNG